MEDYDDEEPRLSGPAIGAMAIAVLLTVAILYNTLWAQRHHAPDSLTQMIESEDVSPSGSTRLKVDVDELAPTTVTLHFDETVEAVQRELADSGLFAGPVDGIAGRRTREAIAQFQQTNGMVPTGNASQELLDQIKLNREFAQAASMDTNASMPVASTSATTDETIRRVQTALSELGYAPGAISGKLSDPTREAIRQFELDRGMAPSGTVSEKLMAELARYGGLPAAN
ncbi:hypothetical protein BH10PSE7_BH10PSE7_23480 [soil metagenome]